MLDDYIERLGISTQVKGLFFPAVVVRLWLVKGVCIFSRSFEFYQFDTTVICNIVIYVPEGVLFFFFFGQSNSTFECIKMESSFFFR